MKTKLFPCLTAILACVAELGAADISLETAPPVIVKTVPVAGATNVDPALAEIKVTYSKAMQDGSWSWSTWGEENYPETTGKPKYLADARTCVLPVKLQPGKFYAIWLNSGKFKNFTDTAGRAAVPYLLTFFTAGRPQPTGDNVSVEDLALRMLAAIRDKEDAVLKELAVDRIKGWRDALPQFAFELRERLRQPDGKTYALKVGESLVEGGYAAVKCTGPKELEGRYLVLFFVKTDQGWLNCSLRNSPPGISLGKHLADCVAEMQKLNATSAASTPKSSSDELAAKLKTAEPTMKGIRENWSATVAALDGGDNVSALAAARKLAPHIQDFLEKFRGTSLEGGAAKALDLVKSLTAALEQEDQNAVQTSRSAMATLGRSMEEQIKAITEPAHNF